MRKLILVVCMLLMASVSFAGGYETKTVFVPSNSKSILLEWANRQALPDRAKMKIERFVFDLNALTKEGWEIKATDRRWDDINDNGDLDSGYEWGTIYTLQRLIPEPKKKGWW